MISFIVDCMDIFMEDPTGWAVPMCIGLLPLVTLIIALVA